MMGALHDGRTVKFDSYNLCSYYTCNDSVVCQFEYKTKINYMYMKYVFYTCKFRNLM